MIKYTCYLLLLIVIISSCSNKAKLKRELLQLQSEKKNAPFSPSRFLRYYRKIPKYNPHIPENKLLHTFLLDEDNKVILAGNPIFNYQIEKMLFKRLDEKLKWK